MGKRFDTANSIGMRFPQLAKIWHPVKNGSLTPYDVTCGSNKKVWWLFPYNDPKTGKHFDFEWKESPSVRTKMGYGCPYLTNHRAWPGYNDLETYCKRKGMEHLIAEWHPTKNGKLTPRDVTSGSNKNVWWLFPYDDPETGKHFDFEWRADVFGRVYQGLNCPFMTQALWPGYNDLETYCKTKGMEYILAEWHPQKNKGITPRDVMAKSNIKRWWICKNGHEWRIDPGHRCEGTNCPICKKID